MEELISIIVPIYNMEKYLDQSIKSIINQSYKNLEIILVNDGSNDSSLSICEYYSSIDKRIKIIDKPNGGLSSARNAGLDVAKGKFIGFIDSDDYIREDMYDVMYYYLNKYKADMIQTNFSIVKEGNLIERYGSGKFREYNSFDALSNYIYSTRNEIMDIKTQVWCGLYKKELFETIRFPEGKYLEDNYVMPKLLYSSKKIFKLDYTGYNYRIHSESITAKKLIKDLVSSIGIWKENHFLLNEYEEFRTITIQNWIYEYIYLWREIDKSKAKKYRNIKNIIKHEMRNNIKYFLSFDINKKCKVEFLIFCISPRLHNIVIDILDLKNKYKNKSLYKEENMNEI